MEPPNAVDVGGGTQPLEFPGLIAPASSRSGQDITHRRAGDENRGVLHLVDVLGVPHVNGSDQRWVDNHGVLRAVRVRFGGEGAGFTPVVNFAKFDCSYPVWPTSVTLEQCYV